MKKNIKIEILTDLYYARFIGIWMNEEEEDYVAPPNDSRREVEKNIPYIVVTNSIYEGRTCMNGPNPVVSSQHPMPPEFLKYQVRGICTMFANNISVFKPPTKMHAELFLSRMRLGFKKKKELKVTVSPFFGNMKLRDFKDSLDRFNDYDLDNILVMKGAEHPDDANKKSLNYDHEAVHRYEETEPFQYITLTKFANVYDVEDAVIDNSILSEENIEDSYPPGTIDCCSTYDQMMTTRNAIADDESERVLLETLDAMSEEAQMAENTIVTEFVEEVIPTKEDLQKETIKRLQAKIKKLEDGNLLT